MAKKLFGTRTPQTADPGVGESVRSIFARAAGVGEHELSGEDIDKLLVNSGITRKDADKIRDAARLFTSSGHDIRTIGNGTFNTFTKEGEALTQSSRKAGNKRGLDVGDLVGLGRKTSTLVGFADMLKQKQAPTAPVTQTSQGRTSTGTPAKGDDITPTSLKTKVGTGDRKMTAEERLSFNMKLAKMKGSLGSLADTTPRPMDEEAAFKAKWKGNEPGTTKPTKQFTPFSEEWLAEKARGFAPKTSFNWNFGNLTDNKALNDFAQEVGIPLETAALTFYGPGKWAAKGVMRGVEKAAPYAKTVGEYVKSLPGKLTTLKPSLYRMPFRPVQNRYIAKALKK